MLEQLVAIRGRGKQITYIEERLGRKLPVSYREFLLIRGSAVVDGFKILGLPTPESQAWKIKSVLEGTLILTAKRPDLPKSLLTICIDRAVTKALCLDLGKGNENDAPLVEVDLTRKDFVEPEPLGKTFREWIEEHEAFSKRFRIAWNRVMTRHKEKGRRVMNWKTVIARVRDYIIGLGAFRLDYNQGCLEVDEFFPIDQPHVPKGTGIRVLLSEVFARARDYSGSLEIRFTQDSREDENGLIPEEQKSHREERRPRPIPAELVTFARERYGIEFERAEDGKISHQEGIKLWFASLELPLKAIDKIEELEKAGCLNKEMAAELVTREIWTKEEFVWIFSNAPRPEALLFGTDLPEDRLYFAESLNWGRAALLATRFKEAIMTKLTEGVSLEEIEQTTQRAHLEPEGSFWILKCNVNWNLPKAWMITKHDVEIEASEPVVLLPRPRLVGSPDRDRVWIEEQLDLLKSCKTEARVRCLLLNSEFIDTLTLNVIFGEEKAKTIVTDIGGLAEKVTQENLHILFAPARTYIFLDEEIQSRMRRTRRMTHFSSRVGPLNLQVMEIPGECWNDPAESRACKALRVAVEGAHAFAEQIVSRRDTNRYRIEFSQECEVIEREALCAGFPLIAEVVGQNSTDLIDVLKKERENGAVTFPFVLPTEMPGLLERLRGKGNEKLASMLAGAKGGIIVTVKPFESQVLPVQRFAARMTTPCAIPEQLWRDIDLKIEKKRYVTGREEVLRTHELIRKAIRGGTPLSLASIRPNTLIEVLRDYIYGNLPDGEITLRTAYGDGTEGQPFPLFSFKEIERPSGNYFYYPVGLVSLRHMDADRFTDRALVRNVAIQHKEDSAEQEELAFRKTFECVEEFLRFLRKEIDEDKLSISLRTLLARNKTLREGHFNILWLHIFHTTALEPAAVGAYRAILEILKRYRGQLIVTPRMLIRRRPLGEIEKPPQEIEERDYRRSQEWY